MAHFDLGQKLAAAHGTIEASHSAQTQTIAIDTQGYEGVAVLTQVGDDTTVDLTTDPLTLEFFEGDDTTFGNATAIPSGRVIDNPSINAPQSSFLASVVPSKRYLFVQIPAPASGSAEIALAGILGYPNESPT